MDAPIEWTQVMDLLDCLGKDPAGTFLRAIKPPRGPAHKFVLDPPKAEKYVRDGWGLYYNVGTGGTSKPEISSVPALWAEWDNIPTATQISIRIRYPLLSSSSRFDGTARIDEASARKTRSFAGRNGVKTTLPDT